MDRGQIFIGKKLSGLESIEDLNKELAKYGYKWDEGKWETIRLDGGKAKYAVHYNDETDFPQDGFIFGIEALATYAPFEEYASQCRGIGCEIPEQLPSGYERDWIQEINLKKFQDLLKETQKDIPDAQVLLMDMHY